MTARGYWIANVAIRDRDAFADYVALVGPAIARFGGRTIVRDGRKSMPEEPVDGHHVIVEFDSYDAALACYRSAEYQDLLAMRKACASAGFVIIEGL